MRLEISRSAQLDTISIFSKTMCQKYNVDTYLPWQPPVTRKRFPLKYLSIMEHTCYSYKLIYRKSKTVYYRLIFIAGDR